MGRTTSYMQREQRFVESGNLAWEDLGGGLKRQLLTFDDNLMMVKVAFEAGGVGALHSLSLIHI